MFVSEQMMYIRGVDYITSKDGRPLTIVKVHDPKTKENMDLFSIPDVTTPPVQTEVKVRVLVASRGRGLSVQYAGYSK